MKGLIWKPHYNIFRFAQILEVLVDPTFKKLKFQPIWPAVFSGLVSDTMPLNRGDAHFTAQLPPIDVTISTRPTTIKRIYSNLLIYQFTKLFML